MATYLIESPDDEFELMGPYHSLDEAKIAARPLIGDGAKFNITAHFGDARIPQTNYRWDHDREVWVQGDA